MNRREFLQGMTAVAGVALISKYDPEGRIAALELPNGNTVNVARLAASQLQDIVVVLDGACYEVVSATLNCHYEPNPPSYFRTDNPAESHGKGSRWAVLCFGVEGDLELVELLGRYEPLQVSVWWGPSGAVFSFDAEMVQWDKHIGVNGNIEETMLTLRSTSEVTFFNATSCY